MRQRNIHSRFFDDPDLLELPIATRLFFVGLWCVADREGRFRDEPRRLRQDIFPADKDCDGETMLAALAEVKAIRRYVVDDVRCGDIPSFKKYQRIHPHEAESKLPAHVITSVTDKGNLPMSHGISGLSGLRNIKPSEPSIEGYLNSTVDNVDNSSEEPLRDVIGQISARFRKG